MFLCLLFGFLGSEPRTVNFQVVPFLHVSCSQFVANGIVSTMRILVPQPSWVFLLLFWCTTFSNDAMGWRKAARGKRCSVNDIFKRGRGAQIHFFFCSSARVSFRDFLHIIQWEVHSNTTLLKFRIFSGFSKIVLVSPLVQFLDSVADLEGDEFFAALC